MCPKKKSHRRLSRQSEQKKKSSNSSKEKKIPYTKRSTRDCNYNEEPDSDISSDEEEDLYACNLNAVNKEGGPKKPICTEVTVNETKIKMEIDTGCAITLISEKIWRLIKQPALKPTSKRLRNYSTHPK